MFRSSAQRVLVMGSWFPFIQLRRTERHRDVNPQSLSCSLVVVSRLVLVLGFFLVCSLSLGFLFISRFVLGCFLGFGLFLVVRFVLSCCFGLVFVGSGVL